jgi:hypothetical protein
MQHAAIRIIGGISARQAMAATLCRDRKALVFALGSAT